MTIVSEPLRVSVVFSGAGAGALLLVAGAGAGGSVFVQPKSRPVAMSANETRRMGDLLSKTTGDVILGLSFSGACEYLGRVADFDEPSHVEKAGSLRYAGSLLHVVRDDHDRELVAKLGHEVFDLGGRYRIERARGLVHEKHFG